ncbi:hypothetical protein ACJX0J_037729, partial [Zea mays]
VLFVDFVTEDENLSQELPRIHYVSQTYFDRYNDLPNEDFNRLLSKVKKFEDTVYNKDYTMEETGENTDLSHGVMANARTNNLSSTSAIALGLVLSQKLSELESALSATPVEVTELIDTLKGERAKTGEGGKMRSRSRAALRRCSPALGRRSSSAATRQPSRPAVLPTAPAPAPSPGGIAAAATPVLTIALKSGLEAGDGNTHSFPLT